MSGSSARSPWASPSRARGGKLPGRRILAEVLPQDLIKTPVALAELHREGEERFDAHGEELDGIRGAVVVQDRAPVPDSRHLLRREGHPLPPSRLREAPGHSVELAELEVQQVGKLVVADVVALVVPEKTLHKGRCGENDRSPGIGLAGSLVAGKVVVPVEVLPVDEDLRRLFPLP